MIVLFCQCRLQKFLTTDNLFFYDFFLCYHSKLLLQNINYTYNSTILSVVFALNLDHLKSFFITLNA